MALSLLLLHGFTGSARAWRPLQAFLPADFPVVTPDLPGHAGTPPPTGSFEDVVDALAHSLRGPAMVHGYSQGARLALALAVRHPSLVEKLSLESGSPGLEDPTARRTEDAERADRILKIGVDAFISEWESQPLFASLQRLPGDVRRHLADYRRSHTAQGLAAALRVMGTGSQPSYWPALPSLRMPVQLITGSLDSRFTTIASRMCQQLSNARHVVIPDCGHAPHLEHPDVVGSLLSNWRNT